MAPPQEKCEKRLQELTGKRYIFFTNRGNTSIRLVLRYLKESKSEQNGLRLFMQDQGGWITYPQIAKKLGFEKIDIKTDLAHLDAEGIRRCDIREGDTVILNSMGGYISLYDMEPIHRAVNGKGSRLINDVSGSIGTQAAKHGDYIVGSFGRWKPINNGYGGFIATDDAGFIGFFERNLPEVDDMYKSVLDKLNGIDGRLLFLSEKREDILEKLQDMDDSLDIVHKDKKGLNICIRYKDEEEKNRLISFCEKKNLEYVECPMYIRINEQAISIEIKRLVQ